MPRAGTRPAIVVSLLILFTALVWLRPGTHSFDVVVYGATPGGVVAAIAAAREGASVVVVEPSGHVGGMVTGGLSFSDTGEKRLIGGISREVFRRAGEAYALPDAWAFEPHVAHDVIDALLAEARVPVWRHQRLESVAREGTRLRSVRTHRGEVIRGGVFVDATYEGDLLAAAGVPYRVGREGKAEHDEPYAGVRPDNPVHQFRVPVNARGSDGSLLPGTNDGHPGEPGAGDRKVQAYNVRLCLTPIAANRVAFTPPPGYTPGRYELLGRYLEAAPHLSLHDLFLFVPIPNDKFDVNTRGPFSTDLIGANWDYPEGDFATRERIRREHLLHVRGLFHFLLTDPRVPAALREALEPWGLCKDEFRETGHWPPQLYVREARRMTGAYVMTQRDVLWRHRKPDSVGMGSYRIESHHVQRFVDDAGQPVNEGYLTKPGRPYEIPYRSLTPRREDAVNLLVPVALSATHVAFSSIRMEPVWMILGHSAGVAAAEAHRAGLAVQDVDVPRLQVRLREQGQILRDSNPPARRGRR